MIPNVPHNRPDPLKPLLRRIVAMRLTLKRSRPPLIKTTIGLSSGQLHRLQTIAAANGAYKVRDAYELVRIAIDLVIAAHPEPNE